MSNSHMRLVAIILDTAALYHLAPLLWTYLLLFSPLLILLQLSQPPVLWSPQTLPVSEPLHLLFSLLNKLCSQIAAWLTPWPFSTLCSSVTFSLSTYLVSVPIAFSLKVFYFQAAFFFKYLFLFIYLAVHGLSCGMWDLVPQSGIKLRVPALRELKSLSHWTTRGVPPGCLLKDKRTGLKVERWLDLQRKAVKYEKCPVQTTKWIC